MEPCNMNIIFLLIHDDWFSSSHVATRLLVKWLFNGSCVQIILNHLCLLELQSKFLYFLHLQVSIEMVYILVQGLLYSLLLFSMIGFSWQAATFFWFFFFIFMSFAYFVLHGMMIVALTPDHQVASILSSFFYTFWNLFSGFLIPRPVCDHRL